MSESIARRQEKLDRFRADGIRETGDWLDKMRADMAAEEAAKAPRFCCREYERTLTRHEGTCRAPRSRSAGS